MCGIAGIWRRGGAQALHEHALAMAQSIRHRGPDDEGVWTDPQAGVGLSHRRLSIIDLSPTGHQPMVSQDQRWVIVYNGETYNYKELAARLEREGTRFRGSSDTEVILEGCARWGVNATVTQLIGMFAFALWDRQERTMWLCRDRLGIKPLYYGELQGDSGAQFVFGSELKALRACPGWQAELNHDALCAYLRHNYIPAPHSIYRHVHKLEPGCLLSKTEGAAPEVERYWNLHDVARSGLAARESRSEAEVVEQLDSLLRDAVRRRMVADVPLGAFLSGGIDSSTVVALMQAQSDQPIRSFSIGFRESDFDESQYAKAVAKHLGTDHTELYVEPEHARAIIPNLASWWDEPFADSSQIPTFLLSELTRQHVTVALSGDGGDELFAGYNRYLWADRLWNRLNVMPRGLRGAGAKFIQWMPPKIWNGLATLIPKSRRPTMLGDKMRKGAALLEHEDADSVYRRVVSHWEPSSVALMGIEPQGVLYDSRVRTYIPGFVDRMQFVDTLTYLPDDILAKVDRASMAVSLEARVPLIDHRVVELSWSLPRNLMLREGKSKWPLRQVLRRYVPDNLVERPKMGFGVPIDRWLRGPLREWAEELLSEKRLREDGIFRADIVRKKWSEHLSARNQWHYHLWVILMFQAWKECWVDGAR